MPGSPKKGKGTPLLIAESQKSLAFCAKLCLSKVNISSFINPKSVLVHSAAWCTLGPGPSAVFRAGAQLTDFLSSALRHLLLLTLLFYKER